MSDVISFYSSPNYVLGNMPSINELRASASRLSKRKTQEGLASFQQLQQTSPVEMDSDQTILEFEKDDSGSGSATTP